VFATTLLLALVGGVAPSQASRPCRVAASEKSVRMYVEQVSSVDSHGMASVRLCLAPGAAGVGSYSATLTFDSTMARVTRVDVSGGMQVANANVAGNVRIAGAAPTGFHAGALAVARLTILRGRSLPKIRVVLREASSPTGASVLAGAKVSGYPSSDRSLGVVQATTDMSSGDRPRGINAAAPHIDSITPRAAHIDNESVLDVVLHGTGFLPTGNVVLFDAAIINDLASEQGGTILRFIAPTTIPPHGNVQARRVDAGKYAVRVRAHSATSNSVTFTVREPDR
jgi:hypothetical protein